MHITELADSAVTELSHEGRYPLPCIDILDTLRHAKYSTIDLSAGYWQVELDPESQVKTAFTSRYGLYKTAWKTAAEYIKSAQDHQKSVYDCSAKTKFIVK